MKSFQILSSTLVSTNSFWLFCYCEGFLKSLAEQDYAKRTLRGFRYALSRLCKANRHRPLPDQHARLARVVRGHCAYYGITGNRRRIRCFRYQVERAWKTALSHRSRDGRLNWTRMAAVLRNFPLPSARVVHSIYAR